MGYFCTFHPIDLCFKEALNISRTKPDIPSFCTGHDLNNDFVSKRKRNVTRGQLMSRRVQLPSSSVPRRLLKKQRKKKPKKKTTKEQQNPEHSVHWSTLTERAGYLFALTSFLIPTYSSCIHTSPLNNRQNGILLIKSYESSAGFL